MRKLTTCSPLQPNKAQRELTMWRAETPHHSSFSKRHFARQLTSAATRNIAHQARACSTLTGKRRDDESVQPSQFRSSRQGDDFVAKCDHFHPSCGVLQQVAVDYDKSPRNDEARHCAKAQRSSPQPLLSQAASGPDTWVQHPLFLQEPNYVVRLHQALRYNALYAGVKPSSSTKLFATKDPTL